MATDVSAMLLFESDPHRRKSHHLNQPYTNLRSLQVPYHLEPIQLAINVEQERSNVDEKDLNVITVKHQECKFNNVEERLERIEGTLSGLAEGLLRIETSKSSPGTPSEKSDDSRSTQEFRDPFKDGPQDLERTRVFHGHVLQDFNGHERYFRSISLASLMWEAHCFIDARDLQSPGSSRPQKNTESSRQLLESLNDISARDQLDFSHDGLPLVLPPKFILDSTIGPFFSQVHGLMPIFNRQNFDANVEAIYSGKSTGADRAWTMCFNNVVLLTLMPKTIQSHKQHSHMDAGLVKAFIDNFRRGYQHLDEFLRPKLCNIQVLITMVLVAQENFQSSISSFLLSQACQLARILGLHQQRLGTPGLDLVQQEERRNVFWSLYILDTTTSFTREKPKYLPLVDCDVDLPPSSTSTNSSGTIFVAKVRLAQVQENTYQSLYSAEAARWSSSKRQKRCEKLSRELERLEATFLGEPMGHSGWDGMTHFRKELQFALSTSRILIRRSRGESVQCHGGLEEAVKCLSIFLSLKDEKGNFGANTVLLRVLDEPSAPEEIKILNEVTNGLHDLQSQKGPDARSCSPLPVACALMDALAKLTMQHHTDDEDLFNDFNDPRTLNCSESSIEVLETNYRAGRALFDVRSD
ncbi:hypothetical protein ACLMJK_000722 [Lecanora helva]